MRKILSYAEESLGLLPEAVTPVRFYTGNFEHTVRPMFTYLENEQLFNENAILVAGDSRVLGSAHRVACDTIDFQSVYATLHYILAVQLPGYRRIPQ